MLVFGIWLAGRRLWLVHHCTGRCTLMVATGYASGCLRQAKNQNR